LKVNVLGSPNETADQSRKGDRTDFASTSWRALISDKQGKTKICYKNQGLKKFHQTWSQFVHEKRRQGDSILLPRERLISKKSFNESPLRSEIEWVKLIFKGT